MNVSLVVFSSRKDEHLDAASSQNVLYYIDSPRHLCDTARWFQVVLKASLSEAGTESTRTRPE
jgi:hypothetical protein